MNETLPEMMARLQKESEDELVAELSKSISEELGLVVDSEQARAILKRFEQNGNWVVSRVDTDD